MSSFAGHSDHQSSDARLMVRVFPLLLLTNMAIVGCATTRTSHVQPGRQGELSAVQSVEVAAFTCSDSAVADAVRSTVMEQLLAAGVRILESGGDALITGTITMSADVVAAGVGGAGAYVSGISAQVSLNGEVVAAASTTQVRTDMWIPDPPQVLARKVGADLRKMLGR